MPARADPRSTLHVFSAGAREPQRHRMFRDWLRTHEDDRAAYGEVKREVAARGFSDAMLYNNEKSWVVYDIYEKIFAADPAHEHDPHPRARSVVSDPQSWMRVGLASMPRGVVVTLDGLHGLGGVGAVGGVVDGHGPTVGISLCPGTTRNVHNRSTEPVVLVTRVTRATVRVVAVGWAT